MPKGSLFNVIPDVLCPGWFSVGIVLQNYDTATRGGWYVASPIDKHFVLDVACFLLRRVGSVGWWMWLAS